MSKKQITIAAYLAGATTLAVSLPVMAAPVTPQLVENGRATLSQRADEVTPPLLGRRDAPPKT